jgi:antitoxin component YwqK of YwqJK toxin-antitoxin module
MKLALYTFLLLFIAVSCTDKKVEETNKKPKTEKLTEIKNGRFTEWYPGKKQIKFQGMLTKKGDRNGKWTFYSENGNELSFTVYENGKKEGFTIVKYPNGAIHYTGEYKNDKTVGVWKTYDEKGKLVTEKDFGYPEE